MCHYLNWTNPNPSSVFDLVNSAVGGDPTVTSVSDLNSLIELGLDFALLSVDGPMLLGTDIDAISHPAPGTWLVPSALDYQNHPSYLKIENVGIKGLDSIYRFIVNTSDAMPYDFTIDGAMGNGTRLNGSMLGADNEPVPFQVSQIIFLGSPNQ
jgi:hypothetical protein